MAKITRAPPKSNEQQKRPAYVCFPHQLCFNPPVAHRHTSAKQNLLTPFEFGVMAAILVAAGTEHRGQAHQHAHRYSGKMLDRKREGIKHSKNLRAVGAKTRYPFSVSEMSAGLGRADIERGNRAPAKKIFKQAGQLKYHRRFHELLNDAPLTIIAERTPSALLASVGLRLNGANHHRLDAALDRLLNPVANWPPVLIEWSRMKDGRISLSVSGEWLVLQAYKKLPLPLPLGSPTVLALFLFAVSLRTDDANTRSSSLFSLFARLGLAYKRRSARTLYATLDRAREAVNDYLTSLDPEMIEQCGLLNLVPHQLELVPVEDGTRVRLLALPRHPDRRAEMEEDIEFLRRRLSKRKAKPQRELKTVQYPKAAYDPRQDPERKSNWERVKYQAARAAPPETAAPSPEQKVADRLIEMKLQRRTQNA